MRMLISQAVASPWTSVSLLDDCSNVSSSRDSDQETTCMPTRVTSSRSSVSRSPRAGTLLNLLIRLSYRRSGHHRLPAHKSFVKPRQAPFVRSRTCKRSPSGAVRTSFATAQLCAGTDDARRSLLQVEGSFKAITRHPT